MKSHQRRTSILRACAWLSILVASAAITFGQTANRVGQTIAGSGTFALRGNVRPGLARLQDQGAVEPSVQMPRMTIHFAMTASQRAQMRRLLADQQTRGGSLYHHWLTPEEYADRFGLTASDVQSITLWLKAAGFSNVEAARSRTSISFSGTAAQTEAAFQTSIHRYVLNGRHFANVSDPVLPKALEGIVEGIRGLNDFHPKPHVVRPRPGGLQAHFTSSISGNHFLAPDDYATIYDVKPFYNSGIDGTGQKIAIAGQTDIALADIEAFRSAAGLSANNPDIVLTGADPGTSFNDEVEADLDIEWSGGIAKNATIVYVNSTDVFTSATYAVDNDLAPVLSISYGACEAQTGSAEINTLTTVFEQANAEGITVTVASGDQGAADCDSSTSTVATNGLAVDVPASIPYVTGIGGTRLNEGTSTYWSSTNNANNGSALSYIPEAAWNDTTADGVLSASGGGRSTVFSKPSWQTGTGVPNDGARDVPDLAFAASADHDGYLICSGGSCVNGFRNTDSTLNVVGGTSCGTPSFAGIVALLNQKMSGSQGNINPTLYSLAASAPTAFHDTAQGNNEVPCQQGSTDCPSSGEIGYVTATGYDEVTGLGSIDAYSLAIAWAGQPSVLIAELPGGASQLSVGSDGTIWGISKDGTSYSFNSQSQSWTQVPGTLTQIAVGSSDVIWALDAAHNIYHWNSTAQAWVSVAGNLSQIAVGSDGDAWGLNSGGAIYHFDSAAGNWDNIPGTLTQLSVGFDGAVWGINSASEIYRFNPGSQAFDSVPGNLSRIGVGGDGDTWGLNSAGSIYHFSRVTQTWEVIAGALTQISVGSGNNVWGLNGAGSIYRFDAATNTWNQVTGTLSAISASADGAVWGINSVGQTYKLADATVPLQSWHQVPGELTHVAVASDGAVWGINAAGQIYTFNPLTQDWTWIPGELSQITVAANGVVWGINGSNQIYRFDSSSEGWDSIPGSLSQIAAADNGDVWGINSAGRIYRFDPSIQDWNPIPGWLAQLSVGADGAVWGVNGAGDIYRFNAQTQNWDPIPGNLSQIAVGSSKNVWGINSGGLIYRFDTANQNWDPIPGSLSQIAVAFDGTVWGINSGGLGFHFNSQTQTWDSIPGSLAQITIGADAAVWGINSGGQIYRFQ